MRENRMCGSEGGEPGTTRLPYPYRPLVGLCGAAEPFVF